MYVQFSESISCCWKQKQVCDECSKNGQVSYSPALRACSHCLNNNVQCVNLAILALSSDCEKGNRKAMELLEQRQKAGLADPQICVYLPDAVHVGKSCRCSFSNMVLSVGWKPLITCSDTHTSRRYIAIPPSSHNLESFLPKIEDVLNKDRMAIEPIIRLTSPDVLKVLSMILY